MSKGKIRKEIKFVFKPLEISSEDSGQAKIFTVELPSVSKEHGMFVRIQSWDADLKHTDFNKFVGKKCKLILEVVE